MIPRHEEWETRLNDHIASRADKPFKWGANDCFFFVSGAIKEMSGMDLTHWIEGKFSTRFGALREAVKLGCKTIDEAEVKILDEILTRQPLCRQPVYGDVMMAKIFNLDSRHTGSTVGMVYPDGQLMIVPGNEGLVFATRVSDVEAVWSL